MANYYHEARAHVRRLKELSDDTRRRAERRAEFIGAQAEQPLHSLVVIGRSVLIQRNTEAYNQIETGPGVMIPWNGEPELLIDRYDGRALMDVIQEQKKSKLPSRASTEAYLTELTKFETYRDLIRTKGLGLCETEVLQFTESESVEIRAAAKVAATQSTVQTNTDPVCHSSLPSVAPNLTAVYGSAAILLEDDQDSDSDESESEMQSTTRPKGSRKSGRVYDRNELDRIGGEEFGISEFSHKLKLVLRMEGETEMLNEFKSPRPRPLGRKRSQERKRRTLKFGHDSDSSKTRSHHCAANRFRDLNSRESRSRSFSPESDNGNRYHREFITVFADNVNFKRIEDDEKELSGHDTNDARELTVPEPIQDIHSEQSAFDPSRLGFAQRTEARKRKEQEREHMEMLRFEASAKDLLQRHKKPKEHNKPKGETMQERLKRLTAAQLDRQAKKDTRQIQQKRIQEERDQATRLQNEQFGIDPWLRDNIKEHQMTSIAYPSLLNSISL